MRTLNKITIFSALVILLNLGNLLAVSNHETSSTPSSEFTYGFTTGYRPDLKGLVSIVFTSPTTIDFTYDDNGCSYDAAGEPGSCTRMMPEVVSTKLIKKESKTESGVSVYSIKDSTKYQLVIKSSKIWIAGSSAKLLVLNDAGTVVNSVELHPYVFSNEVEK